MTPIVADEVGPATTAPFGDAALLVTLGDPAPPTQAARARAAAAAIESIRAAWPAIGRPVAAHATVLVPFDPLALDAAAAIELVSSALGDAEARDVARQAPIAAIEIPVRYGGRDGPDLDEVADLHGLRPADVAELHASATYTVLFLGFAPGFAYLGGLPEGLVTPRRPSPRERVPAGSVGIAGEQTGVYPLAMPGGWRLIGRTDISLFDPTRPEPALLRPGDTVRFVPAR